jgi:hypothetical protein
VSTEAVILVVITLVGLGALLGGGFLLILYFRYSRAEGEYAREPVVYGDLVQCPHCGYMNPMETAACLNCRRPLPRPRGYQPAGNHPAAAPNPSPPDATLAANMSGNGSPATDPAPRTTDAPADMPVAWLEGTEGAMLGHQITLDQPDMLVGRSTVCNVQVYDPKVSRRHFLVRFSHGAFFLQDQNSSRGTRINGQRVMAQRLQDGDLIEIGDSGMIFHCQS